MQQIDKEIIVTAIIAAFLMILLSLIVILSIIRYQRKQRIFLTEKQNLKFTYEQELLKSRLEVQEQVFNTISQEIHDNVGQTLSLAKVQANILTEEGVSNSELLEAIKESISTALSDLRDIARSLSSEKIQMMTLTELVDKELKRINKAGILKASLLLDGERRDLEYRQKLILFRMVQECLQNIIKHAQASVVAIRICFTGDQIEVAIMDDGKGFDPGLAERSDGLGLQHIISRAALIGGRVSVDSAPGRGTQIYIYIPYDGQP
jgi:two-component system NarL family sensor kinase